MPFSDTKARLEQSVHNPFRDGTDDTPDEILRRQAQAGARDALGHLLERHQPRDLYEYLRGNCRLVNPGNACKCAKKTQAFIKGGVVDPEKLTFTTGYRRKVREVADARMNELIDAYIKVGADVYRGHPLYEPSEQVAKLREELRSVSLGPPA